MNCYPGCPAALEGNDEVANVNINFNTDITKEKEASYSFYFMLFNGDLGDVD